MAWGGEAILRDGRPVGEVTSAAYGATLGGIVALGLRRRRARRSTGLARRGRFAIDVAGEIVPVRRA